MSSVSPLQKVSAVDWGCFLRRDDERSYSHSVELPGWAVACLTSEIFGDIWEKKALRKEGWWFGAGGVFFFFQQCRQVRLKHMRERREKDGGYLLQIKGRSTFLSFLNVARLDLESRWVSDWTQTQNTSFFFCLEVPVWTPASCLWVAATRLGWELTFVAVTWPELDPTRLPGVLTCSLVCFGCIRAHVVASSRRFHKEHSAFCWCISVRCVAEIIITDLTEYQPCCFSHVGPDHRSLFLYLLCVSSNQ